MKQSQLFTKTRKEAPSDEVAKNAQLLIRAGYIHKEMAGAYVYLPLGLRVLNNINRIIREEMNAIGSQEVQLTTLQTKETWEKSGRWSDAVVDNWFKTKLKNDTELGLGFTHEEPLTQLLKTFVSSYKDLPFSAYQIQTKFRNEARAKSGIMRGREFLMKDMYSFSRTMEEHEVFYERAKQAYRRVFERLGLGDRTYLTFASGGTFSKYSHEFQTVTDAGEDMIYVSEEKKIAINKEVLTDEVLTDLGVRRDELKEMKAVEVGNIFSLGTKFSDAFELVYVDQDNQKRSVVMGSYGIGPSRLLGTITEVLSDEKGIVLPKEVAPFVIHLIAIAGKQGGAVMAKAQEIYENALKRGVEVLFDDRDVSAGSKLADADLMGIPTRVVVSEKTLAQEAVEVTDRARGTTKMVPLSEVQTVA